MYTVTNGMLVGGFLLSTYGLFSMMTDKEGKKGTTPFLTGVALIGLGYFASEYFSEGQTCNLLMEKLKGRIEETPDDSIVHRLIQLSAKKAHCDNYLSWPGELNAITGEDMNHPMMWGIDKIGNFFTAFQCFCESMKNGKKPAEGILVVTQNCPKVYSEIHSIVSRNLKNCSIPWFGEDLLAVARSLSEHGMKNLRNANITLIG